MDEMRDKIAEIMCELCTEFHKPCKGCEKLFQILALFDEKYKSWKSPEECTECLSIEANLTKSLKSDIDPTSFTTRTVKETCQDCRGSGDQIVCNGNESVAKMYGGCQERWACPTCSGSKEIDEEQGTFVKCEKYEHTQSIRLSKGVDCLYPATKRYMDEKCAHNCQDGYRQINKLEQTQLVWEWRRLK